jgi:hypothetical protein
MKPPVKFSPRLAPRLDKAGMTLEGVMLDLRGCLELAEKHTVAPEGVDAGIVDEYIRDAIGAVEGARSLVSSAATERYRLAGKAKPHRLKPSERAVTVERLKSIVLRLRSGTGREKAEAETLSALIVDLQKARRPKASEPRNESPSQGDTPSVTSPPISKEGP